MRLVETVRDALLKNNEGFTRETSYVGRNFKECCTYVIKNGKLLIKTSSNSSWADSKYSTNFVEATKEQLLRFLHKHINQLNAEGIEQ